mmetsp:Transcript_62687/g.149609  ORF Transcript_62687/g.149609 Transcript_62687/m.149609 type:complete len:206 (+) Transcript_62687:1189-1806(+)
MERLDQACDARSLNAVADIGLHAAQLQHLLLVRVGTVSQGSAAGGSLDRIGNEAARSVALDDIHVQRGDARLSAGLHQHGLLCRTGRGSHSSAFATVLGGTTHNGTNRQVIFLLLTVHLLLTSKHHGANAFRPHMALCACVEGEGAPPWAKEARRSVGRPPCLCQAKVHADTAGELLDVTSALLLHGFGGPKASGQPGSGLRVDG